MKTTLIGIVLSTISIHFAECQHNELIGSKWSSLIMPMNCYDSLEFVDDTKVTLYDCELAWKLDSRYLTIGDTILVETIIQQLEVDDYEYLEPTLIWKLQKKGDQLKMLYMAHRRGEVWVEVSDKVYENVGKLTRVE